MESDEEEVLITEGIEEEGKIKINHFSVQNLKEFFESKREWVRADESSTQGSSYVSSPF